MPRPNENQIPKYEYWGFVQKECRTEDELIPLANNIVTYHNQDYTNNKNNILSFLNAADKVKAWSDYWVTIIQTLGLAYISSQDNLLHKTQLTDFIYNGGSVDAFYYYWALRFQLPFAQNKHREYKEQGIVVQPAVSILEHLVGLFKKALFNKQNPLEQSYLTYKEIILVLMKSKTNSIYEVKRNVNHIVNNRVNGYDYSDLMIEGYNTNENNFSGRARLYLEKFDLIKFNRDEAKICIESWEHYYKILVFLSYRSKAHVITLEDSTRINFFEKAFNYLNLDPKHLYKAVQSVTVSEDIGGVNLSILDNTHNFLSQRGIHFERDFIAAFLLSLKTKPFIILSGISGVGKTILPRNIMKMIGNDECNPIAVAPDWTDNSDMLGYYNVDGKFIIGEFTNLVIEASENPHIPYFIILDEMNLSRVEYYFAQVLSVLESRYFDENLNRIEYHDYLFNKAVRNRLLNDASSIRDEAAQADLLRKIANLKIGENVYIIGTVNIDESTYAFSKKVLDRANVLEINEIDLMSGIVDAEETGDRDTRPVAINNLFVGKITNMTELKKEWQLNQELNNILPMQETLKTWITLLEEFNRVLKSRRLNFGFRVRDEVSIYLYHAASQNHQTMENANWWYKYFDQQLVQKVLTRFSGEQGEIEEEIVSLFNLCATKEYKQEDILKTKEFNQTIKFQKAATKLKLMLKELVEFDRPSTSFWTV